MTDRRSPHDLAVATLTDTTTIATLITPTIHHLQQDSGGYPTHTPGAAPAGIAPALECASCAKDQRVTLRPCEIHDRDNTGPDTPVERLAWQHDQAAAALTELTDLLRELATRAARAATICTRWGLPGLNGSEIKSRLAATDRDIWCTHCSTFGNHEPRAEGERYCRVCADYKRRYNELPTAAIWRARDARGGKLITQDITRIRAREKAERKARKETA